MASPTRAAQSLTLEEFLRLPEIDARPYLEYHPRRIVAKMSPQGKHGRIQVMLSAHIEAFVSKGGLGCAFVELRCTFAGRSLIPDIVFLRHEHIEADEAGEIADVFRRAPDVHVEVVSPTQPAKKYREKLAFSTANDCPLGWLIDPARKTAHVYRPGKPPQRIPADGCLEGEPVLPGYRLPLTELFGWLIHRMPAQPASPPDIESSTPGDPA